MADEKTIKQLADELGVSKQTIQKIIEKMQQKPHKLGNRYLLSVLNQKYIKEKLGFKVDDSLNISDNKSDKTNISNGNVDNSDNGTDKLNNSDNNEYLNVVLDQLKIKDNQIEKLQKLLDQQQILTLQANKKIEELELKNDDKENLQTEEKENKQEQKINEEEQRQQKNSFFNRLFRK